MHLEILKYYETEGFTLIKHPPDIVRDYRGCHGFWHSSMPLIFIAEEIQINGTILYWWNLSCFPSIILTEEEFLRRLKLKAFF